MREFLIKVLLFLISFILTCKIIYLSMISKVYLFELSCSSISLIIFTILVYRNLSKVLKIYRINNVGYYTCYSRKEVNHIVVDVIDKCNINTSEKLYSRLNEQFKVDEVSLDDAKTITFWDHPGITLYDLYIDNKNSRRSDKRVLLVSTDEVGNQCPMEFFKLSNKLD